MHSLTFHGIFRGMDDPRWLRVITVGLVLAALAVGYFFIAGRFSAKNVGQPEVSGVMEQTESPAPVASPSPTADVQALPNTAFPSGLLIVFSAGAIAAGFGLRKFPN